MSRSSAAPTDTLWTVEDVAARWGVSKRTVRRMQAELGARKLGNAIRFRAEDVLAYEDRQQARATNTVTPRTEPTPLRAVRQHRSTRNPVSGRAWEASR